MGVANHRFTICTSCIHQGQTCQAGYAMIARLRAAIAAAGDSLGADFEISGRATLAGCARPCTLAYHSTRAATHLFGDIAADQDIDALLAFARDFDAVGPGGVPVTDPPREPGTHALTRAPAMVLAVEDGQAVLS